MQKISPRFVWLILRCGLATKNSCTLEKIYTISFILYCKLCETTTKLFETRIDQPIHCQCMTTFQAWDFCIFSYSIFELSAALGAPQNGATNRNATLTKQINVASILFYHTIICCCGTIYMCSHFVEC